MINSNCIIIIIFLLLIFIILCSCTGTQNPPAIEFGEFPFRFVYELNGEKHIIEDVVVCEFRGFDSSALFTKPRTWNACLKSGTNRVIILEIEDNTNSVLRPNRNNEKSSITLCFGRGEYYMSDPNRRTLIHGKPHICYNEFYHSAPNISHHLSTPLSHTQAEEFFGIIIIEWNFSEPIKNIFK
jgi:hypothetical protein